MVVVLREVFPGSVHVETLRLRGSDDSKVWATARAGGFVILTKDDDFNARSVLLGAPPEDRSSVFFFTGFTYGYDIQDALNSFLNLRTNRADFNRMKC